MSMIDVATTAPRRSRERRQGERRAQVGTVRLLGRRERSRYDRRSGGGRERRHAARQPSGGARAWLKRVVWQASP